MRKENWGCCPECEINADGGCDHSHSPMQYRNMAQHNKTRKTKNKHNTPQNINRNIKFTKNNTIHGHNIRTKHSPIHGQYLDEKFMWYHRLLNSGDEREAKKVLLEQMQENDNWYTELKEYADGCGIEITAELVKQTSYEQYKKLVKKTH